MSWQASYFSVAHLNPLTRLDGVLHPFSHRASVMLRGKPIEIDWTGRAERELERRTEPLTVEMQLYFSCVVKKRVLFHDRYELPAVGVSPRLRIAFRMVQSAVCDPAELARHFPVRRELDPPRAAGVSASSLHLDFRGDAWAGEFEI